jgi:predicted SnoaL-like aldol condensation-catalyzing enzyme
MESAVGTSAEHNVAVVHRAVEEVWNQRDFDVADALFAPDYVNHGGLIPDLVQGPEMIKISVALFRTAFPAFRVTAEAVIAEGRDTVLLRWTAHNDASSGEQGRLLGTTRSRFEDGKIAESWTCWDHDGVLGRMGLTPALGPQPPQPDAPPVPRRGGAVRDEIVQRVERSTSW